jgi:hypothetical protein
MATASGGGSQGNGTFEGGATTSEPGDGTNQSLIRGIGGSIRDMFKGADKPVKSKTPKPTPREIQPMYKFDETLDKRLLGLADYYYREGSFEKIQFARKWMRNALIFQGYHELEWSEINVAWDVTLQDSGDYAFPNNYYRTLILHGVRAYVQNAPLIEPVPSNSDQEAEAATKAARTALDIIKKTNRYDYLRVMEALNLRIFGNSFRYAYYSKDSRYGYVNSPVYTDVDVLLSPGSRQCPQHGPMEGSFSQCPACGIQTEPHMPPQMSKVPAQTGTVRYPKGEIVTEVVNPLEIYLRSSAYDLWHAPFLIRNRVVDRLALQSQYPDILLNPKGDEGGGEAYAVGGDLGLIYLQSLADLPGDPTQYAAWYERATAAAKALLIECWLRPSMYFFDKELKRRFPDGIYIAKTGDTLLEARNASMDDHWTHYTYIPVPGRIWGDGDDDLIPEQLKLDETDRLIMRNQGYNSAPMLVIDSQRIDKNEILNDPSTIIEAKSAGRPIKDAFAEISSQPLSNETWQWRAAHLNDMMFHSRVAPSAVGQHEAGVNTFGGQESMAAKSDNSLLPNLMLWKVSDESWARQVLQLAADNWLDERVHSVMGINGRWEYEKLRGAALDLDKFVIESRVLPIDPTQQEALSSAVASGLLNPQDPRVMRKALELFHLPTELDSFYSDAKVQWKEIDKMKQDGQQIAPVMIRDNDAVHIEVCRVWLNSDEADDNPQLASVILMHCQLHIMNMYKQQMMQSVVAGAGQPQPAQGGGGGGADASGQKGAPGKQPGGGGGEQGGKHGGQSPKNPVTRQQRAQKGQAAKPHRPQPPSGNQHGVKRLT